MFSYENINKPHQKFHDTGKVFYRCIENYREFVLFSVETLNSWRKIISSEKERYWQIAKTFINSIVEVICDKIKNQAQNELRNKNGTKILLSGMTSHLGLSFIKPLKHGKALAINYSYSFRVL